MSSCILFRWGKELLITGRKRRGDISRRCISLGSSALGHTLRRKTSLKNGSVWNRKRSLSQRSSFKKSGTRQCIWLKRPKRMLSWWGSRSRTTQTATCKFIQSDTTNRQVGTLLSKMTFKVAETQMEAMLQLLISLKENPFWIRKNICLYHIDQTEWQLYKPRLLRLKSWKTLWIPLRWIQPRRSQITDLRLP